MIEKKRKEKRKSETVFETLLKPKEGKNEFAVVKSNFREKIERGVVLVVAFVVAAVPKSQLNNKNKKCV